jgi:CheY-like chemotaxis protein
VRFEGQIEDNVPPVVAGDAFRLGQVLLNLVGNAVKFTERGRVSVDVVLASAEGDSLELEFQVRDTGIGLSAEQRERLLAPFSQADASSTRKYGGSGLGLAIAKQLVELMGGRIWVESVQGLGSCFSFTARFRRVDAGVVLPAVDAPVVDSTAAQARLAGARILVAEDNEFNQILIEELLVRCGASITMCTNGREAVDALRRDRYDVVLMDVQMPVMDGYEATRQIRAIPELSRQPIVALTASAMADDRQRCLDAGMDDFETKPIDPDHMYVTLAKWLSPAARGV